MRSGSAGRAMIALGFLLVLMALGLTGYNLWEQEQAGSSSDMALDSLQEMIPSVPANTASTEKTPGALPLEALYPEEIPDYILNPEMAMPEEQIYGIPYIGYLEIPSLELELPIISTTTGSNLQIAPCRYTGSAYLSNLVLGAHNYVTHFGNIGNLAYGDAITFTDMDGNRFAYEVASIEIIQPDQVDYLCSGEWPLTLYTCTLGGRTRITVRCLEAAD